MAITAKYATSCGVCSAPIAPGERIESLPSGSAGAGKSGSNTARWAHERCAPDALFGAAEPVAGLPAAAAIGVQPTATEVWTDGACSGNPGPGGWAWATRDGRQASGAAARTTNQRMEIQAALEAVRAIAGPLVVVSDSTYVVNCFRDGWWRGWLARGWTTSAKKPVVNQDLWQPLVEVVRARDDVSFRWVKGHSGDAMNDLVDRLAVEASRGGETAVRHLE